MNLKEYLRRRGLGAYLALAFAGLSTLLTVLLVAVIGVTAGDDVRRNIGAGLGELALQTSDKLDRGMFERYREVQLLARRFSLEGGSGGQAAARQWLDALQDTYPYYAWIGAAGLDGRVRVATKGLLEGADVSSRAWYGGALERSYVGDVHEAVLLDRLLRGKSAEPLRFIDIAAPYRGADGRVAGVLGAHLSWAWAHDVEQSILAPGPNRRDVEALIVSADGDVLLGPKGLAGSRLDLSSLRAARSEASGFRLERWPDGKRYLVGFSRSHGHASYPGLGWTVLVRQDVASAFLPVTRSRNKVLWSGIGIAFVFALLGVVVAARISRPLAALSEAAARVEDGDELAMFDHHGDYREVRRLARALSSLVRKLLQRKTDLYELNQTLERRVERRTAELASALAAVEAKEARIHTIIESAQDGFFALDLDGRVTDWNPRAEQMFGWSKSDVMGRPAGELMIPARYRDSFDRALALGVHNQGAFLNQRIQRILIDRDGREFPVEATIGLVGEPDKTFFSIFLHDISERKKVERMKNEFISTVSHELRTPLTAIRVSLGLLSDESVASFDPAARKLLAISQDSCERLVRLINDILDIEKIESGNMAMKLLRQPLGPIVDSAVEATRSYAASFQVGLRIEDGGAGTSAHAAIDRDRMTQVLVNLLSNAVKFSAPGGEVVVRIESRGKKLRLAVIDRGTGIPAEFHGRMFQKFAQADSTDTRQRSGTGLGLSICQQLVAAHGGQISFITEMGQGTEFQVDLPLLAQGEPGSSGSDPRV